MNTTAALLLVTLSMVSQLLDLESRGESRGREEEKANEERRSELGLCERFNSPADCKFGQTLKLRWSGTSVFCVRFSKHL